MDKHESIAPLLENIRYFVKWTVISLAMGGIVGLIGSVFGRGVAFATRLWQDYHGTVFFMPVAGLLIVWLYRVFHEEKSKGINQVLESISAHEDISLATAFLIFVSTILSQSVSASVGREGAALQLGGSLGNFFGKLLRFDEKEKKIVIMCGMSACFPALFGTPLTAAVFSLEVIGIGTMYYAALVPCLFSSFIGGAIARNMGLPPEHYPVGPIPEFHMKGAAFVVLMGILCALVGILLCQALHKSESLYQKYLPNLYLRVLAGSGVYILLSLIFSSRDYNGGGLHLIERCFEGGAVPYYAFLMKIVFTAVVLGAGFKGGEIVPTLCVGATFGYTAASVFAAPPGLSCAVGMACLFVSVTNCPISTLLMAFELFGYEAMPYFALAIAVSFTLSGYYGLYRSQKFICSKIRLEPYEAGESHTDV